MRRLGWFAAAFAGAAGLYVYLWQDACAVWAVLGALCAGAATAVLRPRGFRQICVVCLGLCAGVLWCFLYGKLILPPVQSLAGTEQTVTVRALDQPVETDYGIAVEVRYTLEGRSCRAALYADLPDSLPWAGDTISCVARIEPSASRLLAGDSLYDRSSGIAVRLYAVSPLEVTAGTMSWSARAQLWLQERIHSLYAGQAAGLLRALLTGDRSELSYGERNDMAVAGVSHAIAVSGMHVTMLLTMVALLLGGRPKATALVGIPLTVFFALLTGASPSALRAAFMQVLLLGAALLRREYDLPTALGAAGLLLLLYNPWTIASVSFQMSFAAILGLYLFSGRVYRRLLGAKKRPGRLARTLASTFSATLGATILTAPLGVLYFGTLSLAAPLTNLLVLWAVTAVFTLGLLSCVMGPLGGVLAWVTAGLAKYILAVCRWIAVFPYAAAYRGSPLLIWGLCAYGLVLALLLWKKLRPVVPACILGMALCLCLLWSRWQFLRGEMSFTALDVGQGQCLLLESEGFTAMVDCGGDGQDAAGETAARFLHSAGLTRLNALILTHYDLDHVGGVCQLLRRVRVDRLFLPDTADRQEVRDALEAAALAAGTEVIAVSRKTNVTFPTGELQLLPPETGKVGNESAICVLATAAEYDILITGDLDTGGEMDLLRTWSLPEVDLLVVGHHGAQDAASLALLGTVRPKMAVISVGEDNTYGHPSPDTLKRLETVDAEVCRTDQLGTITIRK